MVQRALSFHTDTHIAVEDVGLLIILINMKKTNYEIKLCSDSFVLIKDIGPWGRYMTVTNAAEDVVEELNCLLNGRRLFYVSDPKLDDKTNFNQDCRSVEQTIVLGCSTGRQILLYKVEDSRLAGVVQVTAAHEMLHMAYKRLSTDEKSRVNTLLQKAFTDLNDKRINELIDSYRQSEPDQIDNELHSILATEVRDLPSELENYYKKYFDNRLSVVQYSEQYESVFISIKDQVAEMDAQLAGMKADIETKEAALDEQESRLAGQRAALDDLKSKGDGAAYNAGVPGYNSAVNSYNSNLQVIKNLINEYNQIVDKRNNLALIQNQLVKSLSSKEVEL